MSSFFRNCRERAGEGDGESGYFFKSCANYAEEDEKKAKLDIQVGEDFDSRAEKAFDDVNEFAEFAITDRKGNSLKQADLHRDIQGHLRNKSSRFNLVEVSRDHGKSTQGLIRILHRLGKNPNRIFKIVCENDGNAKKRLRWIKEQIERNPKVKRVFPHLRPGSEWSKTQIIVERDNPSIDPSIEACGVTSSGTGGRADEILFDDPVGMRNSLTIPAMRKTVINSINNDWLNLLEEDCRASVLCTGWTQDDWIAQAKKNRAWKVYRRPCNGFKSPWPEKWSEKALREQRAVISEIAYQRGFELIPLSSDIVTINKDWIRYWEWKPDISRLIIFNTYDLATGTSKGSDFFAGVTVGLDPTPPGTFYVLRAWHDRISVLKQVLRVISDAQAIAPDMIGIESVQYQAVLPQLLRAATSGLPAIFPINPRVGKPFRLSMVSPQIELARVFFNPNMHPDRIKDPDRQGDIIGELTSFPLGAHDDLVDAFVYGMLMAMEYLLKTALKDTSKQTEIEKNIDDFERPYTGVGSLTDRIAEMWG